MSVPILNTRQRILDTSLDMFSRRGFDAVSVRDISYAVGVKESALYKHFKNKRAVFDSLIQTYSEMKRAYMDHGKLLHKADAMHVEKEAELYMKLGDDEYVELGMSFFNGFLMTPYVMKFWRMISIEQYNDPAIAQFYNADLYEEPMTFQTMFFSRLIEHGALQKVDPKILAVEFYTPLLFLFLRMLPLNEDEKILIGTKELCREHMIHFRRTYGLQKS